MADNKTSFLLYCDIIHTIKKLSNEQAGILFKHVLSYVNDENPVTDDVIIELVFEPIKQSLKRDLQKYERICGRNKINGAKGGRPEKPKKPSGLKINPKNPEEPKKPDSDIVSDIDIVSDSVIDIDKKKTNRFIKPSILEIEKYCIERKNCIDAERFYNHYESIGWLRGKTKITNWKAAVITWEKNNFNQHEQQIVQYSSENLFN